MPVSKKPTKKPKLHKEGVSKLKTKLKQKQKQSVSVNVTIDQSKKGKSSSVPRIQQPTNIISFPANTPVSEIRYNIPEMRMNPVSIDPTKLQDPEKVINAPLSNVEEKPKIYVNPNRPIISDNSLLGAVADVGLQVGSNVLKEQYPEYRDVIDVGGQAVDYLGKKFISGDIQKAGEGLTKQVTKGYNYVFGKKKDRSTSIDAWDTLSDVSVSTHNNLSVSKPSTISMKPPSIAESKSVKKIPLPRALPRQVTIETPPNQGYSDYSMESTFSGRNPIFNTPEQKENYLSDGIFSRGVVKPPNAPSKKGHINTPSGRNLFEEKDSDNEVDYVIGGNVPEGVGREMGTSPSRPPTDYQTFLKSIKGLGYSKNEISSLWSNHPKNKRNQNKK
jgi:hypothetical protein